MCSDRLQRGLERAADTDYLTGLPNRRSLARAGVEAFLSARQAGGGLCLAVFDIDKFKAINDTYGHDAGDRVLVHVANRLRAGLRPADLIARTGGEEFVVLFRDMAEADGLAIVERMRAAVENGGFSADGEGIALTVSAGLAARATRDETYDDLLRRADAALYRAKANGRNRVEAARPDGTADARRVRTAPPALAAEDTASLAVNPEAGSAPVQISR
ncbi:GGDEF domain-containing protein [Shinella zoogloeoides]|uniref:GGDEF domain-containing protein n=1 Tax=Shinella zoogloeoides TaxID=352475 RepID=UPI0039A4A220